MEARAAARRRVAIRERLGGIEGNELLTIFSALVLVVLLAVEGVTLLAIGPLLSVHMFVGLVLIPPIVLKLGSTGYRMVRYYAGSHAYREKGPPLLALRLLAPVLAVTTVGVLATGVWLLLVGHKSDQALFFHKAFFIGWAIVFGIHFLAYTPQALRSLGGTWRHSGPRVPGSGLRAALVSSALGAGVALALSLTSAISGWHVGGLR
jgi:hypothetical protein